MTALWAAPAAADTTVSLTFDDGNADQMPAVQMLDDHGMEGTFYIIPGRVDRPNSQYMTWSQVQTIYDHGNEIGGHTQNHLHLPDLSASQQESEICGGRDSLLARGYPQISFAYPFGDHDSTSEELVQECGYLSGRGVGGLRDDGEPDADTIPPGNPWVLPTPGSIDVDDTLPAIKQSIMDAEAAGASQPSWISLVIHHLCDPHVTNCSDPNGVDDAYITPQDFESLLDWLQPRALTGTHVRTVEEVMTGQPPQDTTPPTSSIQCNASACSSSFYNPSVSVKLFGTDTGGSGLKSIHYTTDNSTPDASDPSVANGGSVPITSTTPIKFRAEDNAGNLESTTHTQTISIDSVAPTNGAIQCNGTTCQSSFYNGTVQATFSGSDSGGSGLNGIRYTTDNSTPNGSSPLATSGTPINVGSTSTIKFRAQDNAGNLESTTHTQTVSIDTAKPTSSILCDGAACSSSYDHAVQATFSGSDTGGSGLNGIRYTTDNSTPNGSSQLYVSGSSPPINIGSTTTIKFVGQDKAGNLESPVHTQTITISIDIAQPTSAILCDGAPCQASYDHLVEATLSATDTGGSGVKEIRYTIDGSDPTSSSPIYSAAIPVSSTTTIKWRAEDNAGNVESPAHVQTIEITSSPGGGGGGGPGSVGEMGGTLGAFASSQSLPNGTVKLTLDVTGPGQLEALDASVAGASAVAAKKRTARVKPTSKWVAQAGQVTLVIRASKAGKRILRRKGKLSVPVRVIFIPVTGSPVAQTVKVKLRLRSNLGG